MQLGCTVPEAQARMTYSEFVEWWALYEVEPWGGKRADLHTAMLMAMIANTNRDRKKRSKPFLPGDFMPQWWRHASRTSLKAKFLAATANQQHRREQA